MPDQGKLRELRWQRYSGKQGSDYRDEFERDVDRVRYSYYYRRLSDITQVSSGHGKVLRHNRLTHSEKVAQVARRLVQYLENDPEKKDTNRAGIRLVGGVDRNVVTAAGLLHDIGHPPFGHIGETELNQVSRDVYRLEDGYEGNAQTLRIISSLTAHKSQDTWWNDPQDANLRYGLDLTRATVAACVKYPYPQNERSPYLRKWGLYTPESDIFSNFVVPLLVNTDEATGKPLPTLEAQIMDWADDITYAVHDLQDWFSDGLIPLHLLRHQRKNDGTFAPVDNAEFDRFWQYATEKMRMDKGAATLDQAREIFGRYAYRFPRHPYDGTREDIADVGALASRIITDASKKTSVTARGTLFVEPAMRSAINALATVTWYYVIDSPELVSVQIGQRAQVRELYIRLYRRVRVCFREKDANGRELSGPEKTILRRRLPVQLKEFTEQLLESKLRGEGYARNEQCYARAVADFIASMTEFEFKDLWKRMCPGEQLSAMHGDINRFEFETGS